MNLNVCGFIGFFFFSLHVKLVQGQHQMFYDVEDFCTIKCRNVPHTMCNDEVVYNCDNYTKVNIFDISTLSNGAVLKFILDGHNGLRDRIARKMHVANMVKLNWASGLADIASKYYERCSPEVDDPCTLFISDNLRCQDLLEYHDDGRTNYKFIAQNRFRLRADNLPRYFFETALSSWYQEKKDIVEPSYDDKLHPGLVLGMLYNENNFTHIASPLVSVVGCSLGQFDKYFEFTCYYYPYYRQEDSVIVFINGSETSECPPLFPLGDKSFPSLCSDGEENVITENLFGTSAFSLKSTSSLKNLATAVFSYIIIYNI